MEKQNVKNQLNLSQEVKLLVLNESISDIRLYLNQPNKKEVQV